MGIVLRTSDLVVHFLHAYTHTIQLQVDGSCRLSQDVGYIQPVICHWACPDPELKLTPPAVFEAVDDIISTSCVSAKSISAIHKYAHGLLLLINHEVNNHDKSTLPVIGSRLSSCLLDVMALSLKVARAGLKSKGLGVKKEQQMGVPTAAYQCTYKHEFDAMVRTGCYMPNRPLLRTLPWFWYDYLNSLERQKRVWERACNHKAECVQEVQNHLMLLGETCNKHKTTHRALLPGMFTVFCVGCGMCEGFEIMPVAESPMTAFHIFTQRAWTDQDYTVLQTYRDLGIWYDHFSEPQL